MGKALSNLMKGSAGRPFKMFFCDRDDTFLMPDTAFKIWMYHYRLEKYTRSSYPSVDTLCKRLGKNRDSIRKHRKWLVDNGWLIRIGTRAIGGDYDIPIYKVTRGTIPENFSDGMKVGDLRRTNRIAPNSSNQATDHLLIEPSTSKPKSSAGV